MWVMRYLLISDLHIGDGSAKDDFSYDGVLVELLEEMSQERITLILNGDAFELLESECIKSLGFVPFEETLKEICPEVLDEIEKNHPGVFRALRDFSKKNEVIYIVGNHDYYLLKNEKLSEKLKEKIGNVRIVPFYYIESLKVLVMHGNQFDVINRFTLDRKRKRVVPPLGDLISRYMLVNFDKQIEPLVPKSVIRDYDNVRPLLDVFNWFELVSEIHNVGEDLVELWVGSFLSLMRTSLAKDWLRSNYPILRFLSKVFLNKFGGIKLGERIVRLIMNLRSFRRTDYLLRIAKKILSGKRKLKDEDFLGYEDSWIPKDVSLKGIAFGHIHHTSFNIFPTRDGYKFYVNTGTWRPVVERIKGKKKAFQKKAELFYAIISSENGEIDVTVKSTLKIEELSPSI